MHTPPIKAYLCLLTALLVYSAQAIPIKLMVSPPYNLSGTQIALLRQIGGSLIMLPLAGVLTWRHRHLFWQNRSFVLQGAFFGFFLQTAFMSIGLEYTTALNVYIIVALVPVAAVIIGAVFFSQPISAHTVFFITLSITGVLIIISKGNLQTITDLQVNVGDILVVMCTFAWAYFGFVMKRKPPAMPLPCFLLVGLVLSSLFSAPLLLINQGVPITMDIITWQSVGMAFYIVVLIQIVAMFAYSYAASLLGGIIPAVSMNLLPILGSIISIIALGDVFHPYHAIAMALIGISVYNIMMRDIRQRRKQQQT